MSAVVVSDEEDGPIADEEATCSSDTERLACSMFSRKYALRTSLAVPGVRMRVVKNFRVFFWVAMIDRINSSADPRFLGASSPRAWKSLSLISECATDVAFDR
jgi:hypothetical protein